MELIKDFETTSVFTYLKEHTERTVKEAEKLIDDGICDEDVINEDLEKKYPSDEYFVLNDYIDDGNLGYFRIRIWKKEEVENGN